MRTSDNKMCDNQPHTEAAGKERLFSVYVFMCECHDQKTKGGKNGKESRRIVNASYIIMIYKYNFATKAGCSVYIFASIQQRSSLLLPSLAPLFANR